jgi:hypothetical protein
MIATKTGRARVRRTLIASAPLRIVTVVLDARIVLDKSGTIGLPETPLVPRQVSASKATARHCKRAEPVTRAVLLLAREWFESQKLSNTSLVRP